MWVRYSNYQGCCAPCRDVHVSRSRALSHTVLSSCFPALPSHICQTHAPRHMRLARLKSQHSPSSAVLFTLAARRFLLVPSPSWSCLGCGIGGVGGGVWGWIWGAH